MLKIINGNIIIVYQSSYMIGKLTAVHNRLDGC